MIAVETLKKLIEERKGELTAIRRHLHQYPELSFEEYKTSEYISTLLKKWGIDFETGWAGTGIVATIHGKRSGDAIALRADMDALPIQEENDCQYASQNSGVMHACGHDVHTACLLIAASVLHDHNDFAGTVNIIFQPGEEKLPGGASLMMQQGLFKKHPAKHIIGQHVYPELPAGKVGFRPGPYMASTDEIYINIKGVGGHAAMPERLKDPVVAAAHVILSLQTIVSRMVDPKIPCVLSIGKILAAGATNVIPDNVYLEGTLRTFDESLRNKIHDLIKDTAGHAASIYGCKAEIEIKKGYPVLINDPQLTRNCKKAAEEFLGKDQVTELDMRMTAEDFAYYTQEISGCFYRLGTGWENQKNIKRLHAPDFDVNEDALVVGAGLMAWMVYYLKG